MPAQTHNMAPAGDAKYGPGGHYSGRNPVPTIQKFVANLDADKKARDAQLAEQAKQKPPHAGSDVTEHTEGQPVGVKGTRKVVTDPTTGKEVQIEDVDASFMKTLDNPTLNVPNANLGRETVSASTLRWRARIDSSRLWRAMRR